MEIGNNRPECPLPGEETGDQTGVSQFCELELSQQGEYRRPRETGRSGTGQNQYDSSRLSRAMGRVSSADSFAVRRNITPASRTQRSGLWSLFVFEANADALPVCSG